MTSKLNLKSNITDHDALYQMIIEMHNDMNKEESESANAKLILTLANHIGEPAVIQEAIAIARENTLAWRK